MGKTFYLVAKENWCIPYYLHNDGKFYDAIVNNNGKIYKTLRGAQKKAKEVSTYYPDNLVQVISMREGELLLDSKVECTYENVGYVERMNIKQQLMYDHIIKTLTPSQIIRGAIRGKETPMEYLLDRIKDLGMPKKSGRLVAETILDCFCIKKQGMFLI